MIDRADRDGHRPHVVVGRQRRLGGAVVDRHPDAAVRIDTGEKRLLHTLRGVGYVLREPR